MRLSQKKLAEKIGVSADAIADWEADRHKPIKKLGEVRNLDYLKHRYNSNHEYQGAMTMRCKKKKNLILKRKR